jgi:hypothetical protein
MLIISPYRSHDHYLNIEKFETSNGAYDDGIYYYFGNSTPGHITLNMSTNNANVESCDIRLTTIASN